MKNNSPEPEHLTQAIALFNAGNAAARTQNWDGALAGFEAALALAPSLEQALLGRARALVRLGQWMPAREAFASLLRTYPQQFSGWLEAGHLCRQMGELKQAAGAYQRAIDARPERYEAPLAMARVLHQLDQKELASQAFAQAMTNANSNANAAGPAALQAEVAHRMGQYLLELGDNLGAVQVLLPRALCLAARWPNWGWRWTTLHYKLLCKTTLRIRFQRWTSPL